MRIDLTNGSLTLVDDKGDGSAVLSESGGSYISDENHTLVMNASRDVVYAFDETGECVMELRNSDDLYMMYLLKHPLYGLSVVASIKDREDVWQDVVLSYVSGGVITSSKSR